jgi:hypothetical protein
VARCTIWSTATAPNKAFKGRRWVCFSGAEYDLVYKDAGQWNTSGSVVCVHVALHRRDANCRRLNKFMDS